MSDLSQSDQDQIVGAGPAVNPWEGAPPTHWYTGLGPSEENAYAGPLYHLADIAGSVMAKGEGLMAGLAHGSYGLVDHVVGGIPGVHKYVTGPILDEADWWRQDAKERVAALAPNPQTTGGAIQIAHGLLEPLTMAGFGNVAGGVAGAAATVGAMMGYNRKQELEAGGMPTGPASLLGLETGLFNAAGVITPGLGGFGSSLTARLLTGAGANVAFGGANRYADHLTLEAAGYPEMARQQKVWDGSSMLFDAIMGAGFGGIGHLHQTVAKRQLEDRLATLRQVPGMEDAVMAAQLGLRAQGLAPGIPADPAAANAHQAALTQALENLTNGEPVNVSGTGVDTANFVPFYHGSPHEFERFDLSKMGSGEGSNSRGPGVYLGEVRQTGEYYQQLTQAQAGESIKYDGQWYANEDSHPLDGGVGWEALHMIQKFGEKEKAVEAFTQLADREKELQAQGEGHGMEGYYRAAAKFAEGVDVNKLANMGGNLYTVHVARETLDRMMDWDKPLAEQTPQVKSAIATIMREHAMSEENLRQGSAGTPVTGGDFYRALATANLRAAGEGSDHAAFASARLNELGVSGIRYLDAGSRTARSAGEGTRNAVLFNPEAGHIVKREGARPYVAPTAARAPISTAGLDPRETILVKSFQDAGLLDAQRNVDALEQALNVRLGREPPQAVVAPLRPEGSPSSPSPTPPVGDRWYADRGAMPGEPAQYLDVHGDDLDSAKAVIVEHPLEGSSNATWEAIDREGQSLGVFDTEEEAGRAAEAAVDAAAAPRAEDSAKAEAAPSPQAKTPPPGFKIHPDEIPRADPGRLTDAQRAIETRFAEQLARDPDLAIRQYGQLEDAGGGRILNTDTARELSEDYLADRSQSAAVHEPASWLIKRMYVQMLKEDPKPGFDPLVVIMAGGTGAGKSTVVQRLGGKLFERAQIIYDTNFSDLKGAIKKTNQALEAGKSVVRYYVFRDPAEALAHGALTRAMKQEAKWGSGRTVPIEEHTNTHVGSNHVLGPYAAHFDGHRDVALKYIDNARGAGNQALVSLEDIPRLEYNDTREQVAKTLEAEYAAEHISDKVYRGFGGVGPPRDARGAGAARAAGAAGPGSDGQYAQEPLAGPAHELTPALAAGETTPSGPGAIPPETGTIRPASETNRPKAETVYTAAGRTVEVRSKLIEAADLTTSDKAGYPQELQPRQRGERTALAGQVDEMARKLKPEMLGSSAEADRGAPIVGPDNVVESGNGRVMALRQVFESLPEQAGAYRKFLADSGYAEAAGMKQPILVRERITPMSPAERTAFTGEANVGTTATYSPVEQAQADAKLLDSGTLAKMAGSDLTTYTNAAFLRDFVSGLAPSERSSVMNPDGTISQAGVRRVQNAILAKAYGGSPESNATLGRLLESTDTGLKSTLNALVDAAPAYARLKQMIEDGVIGKEYDIAPAIVQSVEDVARLQSTGQSLKEHFAQADIFSSRALATQAFYDKAGERLVGRDKAAAALIKYADAAMAQRLNQGNLFGDPPATPTELLQNAKTPSTPDMFGLRTKSGELPEGTVVVSPAKGAIEERPNLELPTEDGQVVRAKAALMASAEENRTTAERAPTAIETATDCFLRRGG